jgi:glycosyltransferase involved in cell wall biosynthesis
MAMQVEERAPGCAAFLKARLRAFLKFLGKRDRKVSAVFAAGAAGCDRIVRHLRAGAPDIPVWLFSTAEPDPGTAALFEKVVVRRGALALFFQAQRELWPYSVAICAGFWTGERGSPLLKLAPGLAPPFRAVFANGNGDFLSGTPRNALMHGYRRLRDAAHSGGSRAADLGRAYWLLFSFHLWRSGPCMRVKDYWRHYWRVATYHAWRSGPCTRAKDYWRVVTYHAWRSGPWRRIRDVAAARALLVASTALRWWGYPDRRLFHRLRGTESLPVQDFPPGEFTLAVFSQAGSNWNGEALERFARGCDARYIVWTQGDAGGDIGGAEALMGDGRTFAVSAQISFRPWQPKLFATAPVRALQPGEASQALAPLSRSIVVDRAKLLALGIPRCGMAWTAWQLLFWKAAAAGWRSYSVGTGEPVGPEADFPLQERAFIFRVLADSSLRRLKPQDAGLARGAIAFRPSGRLAREPRRGRLRVLVVSPFLPYPLAHGGAVRMFNLCRALADRVDFALAAIHEKGEAIRYDELHEVFEHVRAVDLDETPSADERLPAQVRHHRSESLRAAIADLAAEWAPDLLQFEYTHLAAFRDSAPEIPAILVEHDITFGLYGQLAESEGSEEAYREYRRWLEFERRWLPAYDAVWTVCEDDRRSAIGAGARPWDVFTVPNGVDVFRFTPGEERTEAPEILFVGSFRHQPNALGFERLRDEVMPRVWKVFPNAVARVVAGPDHAFFWRKFARGAGALDAEGRIRVEGFVEDLRPLYARAAAVVAPLEVSAGTNIKVLEAMACGKPIVATPIACRGLDLRDGRDALIHQDWEGFASAVCAVLSSPGLRMELGRHARHTAERKFSWTAIQENAYQSYLAVAERQVEALRESVGD